MGIEDISDLVDGYYCILDEKTKEVWAVLKYSPFTGEELPGAFMDELKFQVSWSLSKREKDKNLLDEWESHLSRYTPAFDSQLIPERLKFLINDRNWFHIRKSRDRANHKGNEFCGELNGCFIEACYGCEKLPKLACVPIKYCPFCGVELPVEFQDYNWWEKWFKTFEWEKRYDSLVL